MRRRELMLLLTCAMTASPAARAQQKAMPVIGFLSSGLPSTAAPLDAAFLQGLGEIGYVDGQNVAIKYRRAEGSYDQLPAMAADLVGRKVDVIVAAGSLRRKRQEAQRRRSLSSSPVSATRSGPAWSSAWPDRTATSRASAR